VKQKNGGPGFVYFGVMKLFPANTFTPTQGRLLVADPFLDDDYFRRAVVLLIEHNEKGSLGFVLNKPVELRLHEVLDDFPQYDEAVHFGGPVQRDQLYYIHTLGNTIEGSIQVSKNLWWLGDFTQVRDLLAAGIMGPHNVRFFIGYAGWEAGQLEREMKDRSWYVARASHQLVFDQQFSEHWSHVMRSISADHALMANFPEDPSLN
jgi:putative transcriptional regulator